MTTNFMMWSPKEKLPYIWLYRKALALHMFSEFVSRARRKCKSSVEAAETKFTRMEGTVSWLLWLCMHRCHYAHVCHFLWRNVWCKLY